jgi:hypothetical protein
MPTSTQTPPTPPFQVPFYVPGDRLSESELWSAVLDGELSAQCHVFLPLDVPLSARLRASMLGVQWQDRRVMVSDRSAAWVWGWAAAPSRVTTCVSITARIPSPDRRRLHAREVVISGDEVTDLSGVFVTSPGRTLLDIARHSADTGAGADADADADVAEILAAGVAAEKLSMVDIERLLGRRPRLSFARLARRRLIGALPTTAS